MEIEWQPIWLTIKLATTTTLVLLILGTPLAWWLATTRKWWKELVGSIVALPLVLPPTAIGFYLLLMPGPNGPIGERPLEVVATLRATPLDRFFGIALPLARTNIYPHISGLLVMYFRKPVYSHIYLCVRM